MTQPPGPPPPELSTDVVEFGSAGPDHPRPRAGWLRRSAGLREPRTGWVLGGLAAAALLASLAGEWATTSYSYGEEDFGETFIAGVGSAGNWGAAWMLGALALAAMVGLSLAGPPQVRAAARAAGLAVAAALLLVMVAAAIQISDNGISPYEGLGIFPEEMQVEVSVERGLFAVYAALGLFAAALWVAPAHERRGKPYPGGVAAALTGAWPVPGQPGMPGQPAATADRPGSNLTVQPAEPFIHPTDHEWR